MHETEDVEALAARCAALGSVWREAREGDEEALRSVRRIARSLEGPLEVYAGAEVLALNRRISSAEAAELAELVPRFLEGVHEILGGMPRDAIRILAVEDDEDQATILEEELNDPSREITIAATGAAADEVLREEPPDLILLDLMLPDRDGRDLLVDIRSRSATAATPVIVLTARDEPEVRSECFALGADEVLLKPVGAEIIRAAVSSTVRRMAALRRLAQEDHLTGLPNRAALSRIFQRLQAFSDRNDQPLAMALLDVDHLKDINDRYGHAVGDELLRELSDVVQETLRDSDVLARWGGDEFVTLLPNTGVPGAREAMDKARLRFRRRAQEATDLDLADSLGLSAGITAVRTGESVEEAVSRADHLLYRAKTTGRDSVVAGGEERPGPLRDILVVEDEDEVARIFARFLERDGFRPRRVASGEEAMRAVQEQVPDLVILDVRLPGKDGFEVLREMREDLELHDVPVLIITALGQEDAVVRGFELGVDEYLVKPVSREDFLSRVRRLLRRD